MPRIDIAKARKMGYSDDMIRQFAQSKGVSVYDSSAAQPESSNMLVDSLPLIGAVGGSFIPGAGTIAGGAIGAGLGTLLKQELQGKADVGELATETALGGAGGVAGNIIGKVAGKAGRLVGRGVAKSGETLEKGGEALAMKGLRLNPSQITRWNTRHAINGGEPIERFISSKGLTDAGSITKNIAPLQKQFDAITKTSGLKVDPRIFAQKLQAQADELIQAGGSENAALAEKLLKEGQYVLKNDLVPAGMDISKNDALRRTFASKVNWNNPEKAVIDHAMADALRETSIDTAQQAGIQGLGDIGINLSKLRDLESAVIRQQALGKGSLPIGITKWLGGVLGGGITGGNPVGVVGGMAAQAAASNPTIISAAAKGVTKAGKAIQKGIPIPEMVSRAGGITGQAASQGLGQGVVRMGQGEESPVDDSMSGGFAPMQAQSQPQQTGFWTPEQAAILMLQNPKQAALIEKVYKLTSPQAQNGGRKTRDQVQMENTTLLVDDALSQLSSNPKIKTGFLAPRVEEAKSFFSAGDPATIDFNRTIANIRASVAIARGGTSFTANEEKLLDRYTPNIGDSKQQLVSKLKNLQKIFNNKNASQQIVPDYPNVADQYSQLQEGF